MTNTLQYHAKSTALYEYVLKMSLDIQIGSLGAEKFNFEIHKNTHWKKYLFFPEKRQNIYYTEIGFWIR